MTVKMGGPMPPMPMGGMQQPLNPLPPPMPVPPINPNMQFGQQPVGALPAAAGTFPVSANRRKRFGDSLETMLSRPPMVASDQMANMNVFTGQMMNTAARRPVVQMRGGGSVYDAYKSDAFKSYTDSKKNTFAPTTGTPGRAVKTHQEIMDSIRGGSSPNDDKPAPVVVAPTPASDPLDAFGGSGPDISADPNYVSDGVGFKYDPIVSGGTGTSGLPPITLDEIEATAPSVPVGSGMNPSNVYVDPLDPFGGPGSDVSIPSMQFGDQPAGALPADPNTFISDVFETPTSPQATSFTASPDSGEVAGINLGLGDTSLNPPEKPVGGGQTDTDDPKTIGEHAQNFMKQFLAIPGNIANDFQMALDAGLLTGLLGGYPAMREKLLKVKNPDGTLKYTPEEVDSYIQRTKDKQAYDKKVAEEASKNKSTTEDGTVGGVGTVVDPCPPNFKLDPVSGICVPVEEAEEEGSSLSLNRSRDTEFEELDDIMKRIVKPVDDPVKMQAGGSVGLNRAADNFLAAMGA